MEARITHFSFVRFQQADCIVCKRFRRIGDKILLSSDNPAGREFEPELQDIAWIGIVRRKTVNGDSL